MFVPGEFVRVNGALATVVRFDCEHGCSDPLLLVEFFHSTDVADAGAEWWLEFTDDNEWVSDGTGVAVELVRQ
jgi:hypothetical protein